MADGYWLMAFFESTYNLALIILGFGLLIFVHELGHFLAAKWAGIRTEAFAIGMGTAVVSWRKGVGLAWGSTQKKVVERTGKTPRDLSLDELDREGIGCTEYSLRWLPIGGFVKMLGQDDSDPNYVSHEPGSYNTCPIPKRMVVVSAGVIANVIFAVALFIVAFMIGVQSYEPVIGNVGADLPAGTARAANAEVVGIEEPGLQPGDRVTHIDGKPIRTFVDVRIAVAMARPDEALLVRIKRPGVESALEFPIVPEQDAEGLLGIGIEPGRSSTLLADDRAGSLAAFLDRQGLADDGVRPGMSMVSAAGSPIGTYEQFQAAVRRLEGRPVPTEWRFPGDTGPTVRSEVSVTPTYEILRYESAIPEVDQNIEQGLLGLTPLVRILAVISGRNDNTDVLEPGDVILRIGTVDGPRMTQVRQELLRRKGGEVDLVVLRDGEQKEVTARVDRKGRMQVGIDWAWDLPIIAGPMNRIRTEPGPTGKSTVVETPAGGLMLMPRTRLNSVNDTPVSDWPTLREALRRNTRSAYEAGGDAVVTLNVTHPTPGREQETVIMSLGTAELARLHELSWVGDLPNTVFEPMHMTLSAGGNPLRAVTMGFEETWKVVVMTYLTIDRLVRGSVGVEQIRGPVGIVHIGAQVADRGVTYLLFFLGIISVNLAVINFLPLPIVDGGLFLFLVYEKLKGRPPPLAFQNAATIVGVALIATALLVVTWNDLMRLMP